MGFPRQEYWSGLSFPSPGDLLNPGIKPGSPALQVDSLPSEPPGKPQINECVNPNGITGQCCLGKAGLNLSQSGLPSSSPHHHNHMLLGDTLKSTRMDEREMKQQGNGLELEAVRGTLWRTEASPQGEWQLLPHPSLSSERAEGPFPGQRRPPG